MTRGWCWKNVMGKRNRPTRLPGFWLLRLEGGQREVRCQGQIMGEGGWGAQQIEHRLPLGDPHLGPTRVGAGVIVTASRSQCCAEKAKAKTAPGFGTLTPELKLLALILYCRVEQNRVEWGCITCSRQWGVYWVAAIMWLSPAHHSPDGQLCWGLPPTA